jgi:hypothetical protein
VGLVWVEGDHLLERATGNVFGRLKDLATDDLSFRICRAPPAPARRSSVGDHVIA